VRRDAQRNRRGSIAVARRMKHEQHLQKLMDEFLLSFQPSRPAISGQKIKRKYWETAPAGAACGSAAPRRAAELYISIFWGEDSGRGGGGGRDMRHLGSFFANSDAPDKRSGQGRAAQLRPRTNAPAPAAAARAPNKNAAAGSRN
jgi:hypothetical protein